MKKLYLIGIFLLLFSSFVFAGDVVINEFMANADQEWIEIYNNGSSAINLSGWTINDAIQEIATLDTIISSQSYLVINISNKLNNDGDNIILLNNSVVVDNYEYFVSSPNESIGRLHNNPSVWLSYSEDEVTKGAPNNKKPTFVTTPGVNPTVNEDSDFTYAPSVNEADGDSLDYSVIGPSGVVINSTNGFVNWSAPVNDDVGKHNISIFVNDGYAIVNQTFELEVLNTNDDPVIINGESAPVVGVEGILYAYDFDGIDIDSTNDTLTFSLSDNPDPSNMIINSSGYLTWTPSLYGDYTYNVTVSDGNGGSDEYQVDVSVDKALDFKQINLKVNGVSNLVSGGDYVEVNPGDDIEVEAIIENNMYGDRKHIEDIVLGGELELRDVPDVVYSTNYFGLDPSEYKTKLLNYTIPYGESAGISSLQLVVVGNDKDSIVRTSRAVIGLNVTKNNDEVIMTNVELDNNLGCYRWAELEFDLINNGYAKQYDVTMSVSSSLDAVFSSNNFDLDEGETITDLNVKLNATDVAAGTYPFTLSVNYGSGFLSYSGSVVVKDCITDFVLYEENTTGIVNYDLILNDPYVGASNIAFSIFEESNTSLVDCSINGQYLSCTPSVDSNDFGSSDIVLRADYNGIDVGLGYSDFEFSVYVLSENDRPVLSSLPQDSAINEDTSGVFDFSPYVSDSDGGSFSWSYSAENISISFNGNEGTIKGKTNWYGSELVNITVSDGYYVDSEIMLITVLSVDDEAEILSVTPVFDSITLGADEEIEFSVTSAVDVDNDIVYTWELDGVDVGDDDDYIFSSSVGGEFELSVDVNGDDSYEWNIIVTDVPIASTFDGGTTVFDSSNLSVQNLVLEKETYGKIDFGNETLDMDGVWDLDNYVVVGSNIIAVDTTKYPNLNKPAIITMKGLSYNEVPKIYYNSGFTTNANIINTECNFCTLLNYTNHSTTDGTVVFYTEHFSSFKVGFEEVLNYSDLDVCSSGVVGDLEVSIEEPDDDEEYGPGDSIEIEVEVKNEGSDDKDIKVVAVLYDLDDDDVVDEEYKTEEVDEDDEETFELTLKVPNNADEDHEYVIYVKAYEKGDEDLQCVEDMIDVDVEREAHEVIIDDFSLLSSSVKCGDIVEAIVEIENIGSNDEDVVVTIENSELGIFEESIEYELDDYNGDDEDAVVRFNIKIPEGAETKTYSVKAKVDYEDGSDTSTKNLEVYGCGASVNTYGLGAAGELDLLSPSFNAKTGQSLTIPVRIKNNDDYKKMYSLSLENLGGWGKSLTGSKVVSVGANTESTEYMYLKIDEDAYSGMHTIGVKLSSGTSVDEQMISVNVAEGKKALFIPRMKGDSGTLFFVLINVVLLLVVAYLFKVFLDRKKSY